MEVSRERLREDVRTTGSFGSVDGDGHGRTCLTGTAANREAREYLVERMEDADLDVTVDAVGNVVGLWTPASADPDAAPVACGSHVDSVPEGGWFDGPLGVYAALESVRAMQDAGETPARPVAVVSFTEEEGQRFGGGLLGSAVAAGKRQVADALSLTDDDGVTLEDALEDIGFRGDGRVDAGAWDSWLELHVEQDTVLEESSVPVGVVTTITGILHVTADVSGETDHAGSTAMADRTDALAAASEVVTDVERAAREVTASDSETAVATVGKLDVTPNATNVVPGRVEMGVDLRDVTRESMDYLLDRLEKSLQRVAYERHVEVDVDVDLDVSPCPMSERCRTAVHDAAHALGVDAIDMHSGAAHDTMHVASVTDAGLVFAPSRDGISHSPLEWTDWEDCAVATSVLAEAVASLAGAR